MSDVKELYKSVIMQGFYDEQYGMKPQIIDGKKHGVCIDFSRDLVEVLRQNDYLAGLISTLNDDGYLHAAVLYKNLQTGKVKIADPVTDVRKMTGLTDEQRQKVVEEILISENWNRKLEEYIKEYGIITAYNDDLSKSMERIRDREELEAVPQINGEIQKKIEPIQTLTALSHVKSVADGPTLLACQTLYKKGISTYCSNYTLNGEVSINVDYNSLSEENKEIVLKLRENNPENYYIQRKTGFYGSLGHNEEVSEDKLMELVFGFSETKGKTTPEINLKMNQLIAMLKKQPYLQGVYTRQEVLNNRHHLSTIANLLGKSEEPCKSSQTDTNEQIASNEGLIYSEKYSRFFADYVAKSRYIESLYRQEHDLRNEEEIARESRVFYDTDRQMFFETEREAELYKQGIQENENKSIITSTDIVEADMSRKVTNTITEKIKNFFDKIIDKLKGKGER